MVDVLIVRHSNMPDSESALNHLHSIVALGDRLKEFGIAIYEHHYLTLVFGSWTLIAGKRKERIKISWDGRDGFLDFSEGLFPDSSYSSNNWRHIKNEGVDFKDPLTPYDRAERFLTTKYNV